MTRYDTSAQARARRDRRRINLVLGGLILLGASYIIVSFILQSLTPYPPLTSFPLVLALLMVCLSLVPLVQALLRRPHPEAVEVRDDALVLRFARGPPLRFSWEAKPVELAYDTHTVTKGRRPPEGMEVQMYVPIPGRDPSVPSFRLMEVDVSLRAFQEVRGRMEGAGFLVKTRRWSRRRPGDLVEFLRPGEEELREEDWPDTPGGLARLGRAGPSRPRGREAK